MIPIYYTDRLLEYKGRFPDVPERLTSILKYLQGSELKYKVVGPRRAKDEDLLRAHDELYLKELKEYKRINSYFPDEPIDAKTYEVTKWSAGAAISAAKASKKGFAFALTRPKGNNAGHNFFGNFSYVNNMAVAILNIMDRYDRILIIDFDAHFCNGTYDILKDEEKVSILSIHQHAESVYPYIGRERESTPRALFIENRLWITDGEYLDRFRGHIPKFVEKVKPDLIGVSAGFNIFHKDVFFGTVSNITNPMTFGQVGRLLSIEAERVGADIFGVLEGGYWLDDLGKLVCNFLKGFEREVLPDVVSDGDVPRKDKEDSER